MKKLLVLAAVLMASSAAHAGDSFSFDIGGRTVHIDAPKGCDSPSCVSISIPGVYESKRNKRPRQDQDQDSSNSQPTPTPQASTPPATNAPVATNSPVTNAPSGNVAPPPPAPTDTNTASSGGSQSPSVPASNSQASGGQVSNSQSLEPANGTASAPQTTTASASATDQPAAAPVTQPAPAPAPVVASAPVAAPVQNQQAPVAAKASPLGVWLTEEKEGKVRIEACGNNLCGFSMKNNEKILINMKPVNDNKWSGRIHDPNSGSNYDSTIALKGSDQLRVQGCAFGGMFCGGQTWSRVN